MASRSILLLLVLVLVATRMGSSVEESGNAPAYAPAPVTPAYYPPATPLPYGVGTACTAMCATHCRLLNPPRRACMHVCTACCRQNRCVPEFSKCCVWDTVIFRGKLTKCY